jgi:hypothetical protein
MYWSATSWVRHWFGLHIQNWLLTVKRMYLKNSMHFWNCNKITLGAANLYRTVQTSKVIFIITLCHYAYVIYRPGQESQFSHAIKFTSAAVMYSVHMYVRCAASYRWTPSQIHDKNQGRQQTSVSPNLALKQAALWTYEAEILEYKEFTSATRIPNEPGTQGKVDNVATTECRQVVLTTYPHTVYLLWRAY